MPGNSGKATILVVDDEVSVRQLLVRQLRSENYDVLEAGYGLEALEVARSSSEPIDLVLSDIVMPGMIGTELAERLLAEHPGIRVVLMSAHAIGSWVAPRLQPHDVPLLAKPFDGRKMLAFVELVLSRTPEGEQGGGPATGGT
jgi:two-component system, cell cycle sensor histidine kinase and response regulator CckA